MERQHSQKGTIFINPELILGTIGVGLGERVADFGCGGGYFSLSAARLVGAHGVVYAIDIQKSALSSVAGKARLFGIQNITPVWSNVETFRGAAVIPDRTIHLVLLIQILSQSTDRPAVWHEVERVLRPDGRVLVVDWKNDVERYGLKQAARVTVQEIIEGATARGLKQEKTLTVGPYHVGLLFRKR